MLKLHEQAKPFRMFLDKNCKSVLWYLGYNPGLNELVATDGSAMLCKKNVELPIEINHSSPIVKIYPITMELSESEGCYPRYNQLWGNFTDFFKVPVKQLKEILKKVKDKQILINIEPLNSYIKGESSARFYFDCDTFVSFKLIIQKKYLEAFLKTIKLAQEPEIVFKINSEKHFSEFDYFGCPRAQTCSSPLFAETVDYKFIVMPITVSEARLAEIEKEPN